MAKIELTDLNSINSTPAGFKLVSSVEVQDLTETDMSSVVGGIGTAWKIVELLSLPVSLKV